MRARILIAAVLSVTALALPGCSYFETSDRYTDEARLRATIRDEFDQIQIERGRDRRAYIDERVAEAVAAQGGGEIEEQFAAVEARVGRIETQMQTIARRPADERAAATAATPPAITPEEVEALKREVATALAAVSELENDRTQTEAAANARFERLEFRTRNVNWPIADSALGLHLASYRTHRAALRGWQILQQRHTDVLGGEEPLYVEINTVSGPFVRVVVGAGEQRQKLQAMRDAIRERGDYAMVMPILHNQSGRDDQPKSGSVPGS